MKISPDGSKVDMDANNFHGTECTDFSKGIVKALGEVEKEGRKPEFYKTTSGGVTVGA